MKRRHSLGDKGVTPVIAIIMLLLIVVVMVGGVFAWMQTMQEDIQAATQEQLSNFMKEVKENIKIENYQCNGNVVEKIYVRNNDEVDPYNVTVYVNGGMEDEDVELEKNSLTELIDEPDDIDNGDIVRGDTLSLGSEGEIIQSQTFSC